MIAKTARQADANQAASKKIFHCAGEAEASGEADASGAADASGVARVCGAAPGVGAVVVSGKSEAGGGSDASASAGGNGATSLGEPRIAGPPLAVCPEPSVVFFFAASASPANAGFNAASPTFERNWSILFFAFSLSAEPGC